jgi:two-component system NtrC family sensor kinase
VIGRDLVEALIGPSPALVDLLAAARAGGRVQPLVVRSSTLGRTMRVNVARIPPPAHDQSVVVLVEDVTDQQALESQLIQSEKLAAVGQLVSGVAHELNNPLTSIAGLSEFLLEQKELGTKDRGHLRVIHEQADRAGRIVRNLLTFARKGPGEQAPVDLSDVVQRTLLLMSYDLTLKEITIERDLAPVPRVLGDAHALQQVVLNLLNNAAQAIAANAPGRRRAIRVSTWFENRVRLRVADTGTGIPDEVLPHLFTPFFTTKEPGEGTGLGLSITYSIVEAHGGHITVVRPLEGGAAFVVDLPPAPQELAAATPAASADAAASPPPPAPPATKRAILLVDDDPAVRRMVKALFGREGHTVDVARNPQQALDLARTRDDLFIVRLLESHPALKDRVLVSTGEGRPTADDALARLGLRYVRKPFNLRDLRDEAARLWAGRPGTAAAARS